MTLEIIDSFIKLHERPLLMLSLFRDVTTQRQLEEQLRQSQKMEAIGQLAGGVAHDFNNILTVIQGHASLLLAANLGESAGKSAQQIVQAAERAAGLTRQLLTFSRRQLIQPKRLDMNKVVGNMTNMLGRLLGEDVALQLNYCQSPPMVEADAGMLEQVLLNLAVNARDAMPKGGQLAIRIAIVDVDETYSGEQSESHAALRLSWTGYQVLTAPNRTVVISCSAQFATSCPTGQQGTIGTGGLTPVPGVTYYYLFKHGIYPLDSSSPFPQMTGKELKLSGTQADIDPTSGLPIVTMQFTGKERTSSSTRSPGPRRSADRRAARR